MAVKFIQTVVSGYFSLNPEDVDCKSIEDFLSSSEAFQLIAIDHKDNVEFTSSDNIPIGVSAIIFKKPKGVLVDASNMANTLSFHTFLMADGPSSYLSSNRKDSKRLGQKLETQLGDTGRTLVENLDSIKSESEVNLSYTLLIEILSSQKRRENKEIILRYADAAYAEFGDKLIQNDLPGFKLISDALSKLANTIDEHRIEECDQTKYILRIWRSLNTLNNIIESTNTLCNLKLSTPVIMNRCNVSEEAEAEVKRHLKMYSNQCKSAFINEINKLSSPSRVLNMCSNHITLLSYIDLDEKDALVTKLKQNLESQVSLTHKSSFGGSQTVKEMINSMWVEYFSQQTINIANAIGSEQLLSKSKHMHARQLQHRKELFNTWQQQMEDEVEDLILEIDTNQKIFSFAKMGKLQVRFSPRWEIILRDIKQVTALGLKVSSSVQQQCSKAAKFYRAGVSLQQITHFYNNIGNDIIPSAKPMLLKEAISFEAQIKSIEHEGNGIAWNSPAELERFSRGLMKSAENLKTKNDVLKFEHAKLETLTLKLIQTDLVRRIENWKDIISSIRTRVQFIKDGYGNEDSSAWRTHWDRQLYKVLDLHYSLGISTLTDRLPCISLDLVIRGNQISFRPELENLRSRFYKELKRFSQIPYSFHGVSDEDDLFLGIGYNNSHLLSPTIKRGEEIFSQLVGLKVEYNQWVLPAQIDLEKILTILNTETDFEDALRKIKLKGKELERLNTERRIGFLSISLSPMKMDAELLFQKCYNGICASLGNKIDMLKSNVIDFIKESCSALDKRAASIEEITKQQKIHSEIVHTMNTVMKENKAKIVGFSQLYKRASGNDVDLSMLNSKWEEIHILLKSHNQVFHEQMEQMKSATKESADLFVAKIEKLLAKWTTGKAVENGVIMQDSEERKRFSEFVSDRHDEIVELSEEFSTIQEQLRIFDLKELEIKKEFESLKADVEKSYSNWSLMNKFEDDFDEYFKQPWLKARSRLTQFQTEIKKWQDEKLSVLNDNNTMTSMQERLLTKIKKYNDGLPSLKWCNGEHFTTDHWLDLFRILEIKKGTNIEELTFGMLLSSVDLIQINIDKIKAINERAQLEITVRESLRGVEMWAATQEFVIQEATDTNCTRINLIKDWRDAFSQMGDQQRLIATLKESASYQLFSDEIDLWDRKLSLCDSLLSLFCEIQRRWLYLEPVFCRDVFPSEKVRFNTIDGDVRSLLSDANRIKLVVPFSKQTGLLNKCELLLQRLHSSQKALSTFLESKRDTFSRFFFLGDDCLLEILGQPKSIQSHLRKLFPGVAKLVMKDDSTIVAVKSMEDEEIPLSKMVKIERNPEMWLKELSIVLKSTLKRMLSQIKSNSDIENFPAQMVGLVQNINFTKFCERAIKTSKLEALDLQLKSEIGEMTSKKGNISRLAKMKITSLVLGAVHHRDIIRQLLPLQNLSLESWEWSKQLRFYRKSDDVSASMIKADIDYSWEYQGVPVRLVHTALTDKCFLVLTQAISNGLGGNPYGPAGTGKTETVKELGSLMGRHVLVFNCDEGLDVQSMSKIFMGLCRSGAWGCFDEFNRLTESVLSAISTDIQTIQLQLMKKEMNVTLQGVENELSQFTAIFVTLNPAGKGYGGRRKLPDNLKSLFRPVAMTRPENSIIAAVILFSEGFTNEDIGKRLVRLYGLCKKLLSEQQHYDWGLRALKTVLRTAGKLLNELGGQGVSETKQLEIAVRAININTISKLTYSDALLFHSLVSRSFPECDLRHMADVDLEAKLTAVCKKNKLFLYKDLKRKCSELLEQMRQRIGVVICGPPASGKTTLWKLLSKAESEVNNIVVHYMNPKAVSREELLGFMDATTREWNDGILTRAARRVNREIEDTHWIVCDGEIDPDWIEALNSVLDDNRLLTLPNGERIQFGSNVNFIFETSDLKNASPATISRMGVIFLSPEEIKVNDIAINAIKELATTDEIANDIIQWTKTIIEKGLNWLDKHPDCQYLKRPRLVRLLDSVRIQNWSGPITKEEYLVNSYRSITCGVVKMGRKKLAKILLDEVGINSPCVRVNEKGEVTAIPVCSPVSDIVPTVNLLTQAESVLLWLQNSASRGIGIIGEDGCGKSTLLKHCLKSLVSYNLTEFNCSLSSKSSDLINVITSNTVAGQGQSGRILRPSGFEHIVIHIKGINITRNDKWGTNNFGAFVTQLITSKGYYNENKEWIGLENIKIVISLNQKKGKLEERLATALQVLIIDDLKDDDIVQISTSIWKSVFGHEDYQKLANASAECVKQLQTKLPLSKSPFYNFNLQHLSDWANNLKNYQSKDIWSSWKFEAERIFRDRLITAQDRAAFDSIISQTANSSDIYFPRDNKLDFIEWKELQEKLSEIGEFYSREVSDLPPGGFVTSFELAMNVVRVSAQLSISEGNLVLIGSPGSGRRTAVTFVSHYLNMTTISPPISNINDKSIKTFFKNATGKAAFDDLDVCLIVEEHHLTSTSLILEYLNTYLSQGYIHGLWSSDDLESLKSAASATGQSTFDLFKHRCQQHLRVVVILDQGSSGSATCWKQCPSLTKMAKIITFLPLDVCSLEDIAMSQLSTEPELKLLSKSCADLYSKHGWNLAQYHFLLQAIRKIYHIKKDEILSRRDKLSQGLSKLNEAADKIRDLEEKVQEQGDELMRKRTEADAALKAIQLSMHGAEAQKSEMQKMKHEAAAEQKNIESKKKMIQQELDEVQPIVEQAKKSVGNIKPSALNEIRTLRAPPVIIRDILEGVLKIMGNQDTSWTSMKSFLGKRGVKDEIAAFDARSISVETRKQVEQILGDRHNSFTDAAAKRASVAAQPLAIWVRANIQYAAVLERIAPLEAEENRLTQGLAAAVQEVDTLGDEITTVEGKVAILKNKFEEKTGEAAVVAAKMQETTTTLKRAGALIDDLQREKKRWEEASKKISEKVKSIPYSSLLSAGHIVFLSSKTEFDRKIIFDEWNSRFGLQLVYLNFISAESTRLEYHQYGLPNDNLSLENSFVMLSFIRPVIILDQSGRSQQFIRNYIKDITTLNADYEHLQSSIELAVRFGKTVFIENVLHITPFLFEVLRNQLLSVDSRASIKLGSSTIDVNPAFRIILASKTLGYDDIKYLSGVVCPVVFAMTQNGLEHQFLSMAIKSQNPELEESMVRLVKKEEDLQIKIISLEDEILSLLANSEGDILSNIKLIESLKESKKSTNEGRTTLEEIKETKTKFEQERNIYFPLAAVGASAVFKFQQLTTVNTMYTTGLHCILVIFGFVLKKFELENVSIIKSEFIKKCMEYIYQMSLTKDQVPNMLHVLHGIAPDDCREWDSFVNQEDTNSIAGGANISSWIDTEAPEMATVPNLTNFQQLLAITKKRPDRFFQAANVFISKVVPGIQNSDFQSLLQYEKSDCPILVLLSGGVDPTTDIAQLAEKNSVLLTQIALEDRNDGVLDILKDAAQNGTWVLLKNCHLGAEWMNNVESLFDSETIHGSFRLWLASEYSPKFSRSILRRSIKFNVEAPPGLNRAMQRISSIWENETTSKTLQFSLLHAVIEERLSYAGVGWSKAYDFNKSDLRAALNIKSSKLYLKIICDVIYGSRLDNENDVSVLNELAKKILSNTGPELDNLPTYPETSTRKDHELYISKLPIAQTGLSLGLSKNADRSLAESRFDNAISVLVRLDRQKLNSVENWYPVFDELHKSFYSHIDKQTIDGILKYQEPDSLTLDSVKVYQSSERRFGCALYGLMKRTITNLKSAMEGQISSSVQEDIDQLILQQIPVEWNRIYYKGSQNIFNYVKQVASKLTYLFNQDLNDTIDVSRLFRPSALIVSLEQKLSPNNLTGSKIINLSYSGNIKLEGLLLTGADFNNQICKTDVNTTTLIHLPPLAISFTEEEGTTIPLYNDIDRETHVSKVMVPGLDNERSNTWTLNGTALFLSSC